MKLQDLRQTKEYSLFLKKQGWQIERMKEVFIFIKKLPFLPISVIKIQRPREIPHINLINQIAKKHHAIFVKIEPFIKESPLRSLLAGTGFRKDSWPLLPPKTLWIELKKSEEKLLSQMNKKTRYDIRQSLNSGLKIEIILGDKLEKEDLENFYQFFKSARKEKSLWISNFNYLKCLFESFGKKSFLLQANCKKEIVAGVVLLFSKDMAFYYFAASNKEGKKLFAPTALAWQAIKFSKKKNKKIFDFEGIYDPRFKVTKAWQGFSHFKKGFGGEEKKFPGSFIKYYLPI